MNSSYLTALSNILEVILLCGLKNVVDNITQGLKSSQFDWKTELEMDFFFLISSWMNVALNL